MRMHFFTGPIGSHVVLASVSAGKSQGMVATAGATWDALG